MEGADGHLDPIQVNYGTYEDCVSTIHSLELEGHLSQRFSIKFLEWFRLEATSIERNRCYSYIDCLSDAPRKLADQLIYAFFSRISKNRGLVIY